MADVKELNINNTTYDIKAKSVVDTNSGALKFWSGTQTQYDAIATKDADTLYNITDDSNPTLSMLELLYPIGAIYIGTMSVCPLQTLGVGIWQIKGSGSVLQGADSNNNVGQTIEAGLPDISGEIGIASFIKDAFDSNIDNFKRSGVFSNSYGEFVNGDGANQDPTWFVRGRLNFNASASNSIYGNSTTVQPQAYVVNIWERIS